MYTDEKLVQQSDFLSCTDFREVLLVVNLGNNRDSEEESEGRQTPRGGEEDGRAREGEGTGRGGGRFGTKVSSRVECCTT